MSVTDGQQAQKGEGMPHNKVNGRTKLLDHSFSSSKKIKLYLPNDISFIILTINKGDILEVNPPQNKQTQKHTHPFKYQL